MGKASSEESITDAELAEMEDIAEKLPSKEISHDASDLFLLEKVIELQPDLVPEEFYDAYRKYLKKEPEYSSQAKVMKKLKSSKGTVYRHFKTITETIAALREDSFETAGEEIPALSQERTTQILKNGVHVQLDPYTLLPPEGHSHYKLSRYFQRRRGPRQHPTQTLAESIGKIGMIEMLTVQDVCSENGFIQRLVDGFNRLQAWIIANEAAGGTAKNPVLEYPVSVLVQCTNAEGELIALEKNQNKDNFDLGDRDYSIVLMHENHPQVYPQKRLSEIFNLTKQRTSNIIGAWRESWPPNEKKGETPINNPIRQALVDRKITTKHGEELARLKKWPSEQRRLARWILKEVTESGRKDANIKYSYGHDETRGRFPRLDYDYDGVSAGRLKMMVSKVIENMGHVDAIKKDIAKRLKDGKIGEAITEDTYSKLRSEISKERTHYSDGIPKKYMSLGLKEAGVKVSPAIPEPPSKKPISPATVESMKSEQETLPESEPVKVCNNCPYADDPESDDCCPFNLKPDENNDCPVQFANPGRPKRRKLRCPFCNGLTIEDLLYESDIEVQYHKTKSGKVHYAHTICIHDEFLKKHDVKGYCQKCLPDACELLRAVKDGSLDVEVKFCPETGADEMNWFIPRPDVDIKKYNKEIEERARERIEAASKVFEKTKAEKAAGRSA